MDFIRRIAVGSLVPLVMGLSGCEYKAGGDYNRTVRMPSQCKEVISAGSSNSIGYGSKTNWDWISCKDANGGVTIYRMHKTDDTWFKTEIRP